MKSSIIRILLLFLSIAIGTAIALPQGSGGQKKKQTTENTPNTLSPEKLYNLGMAAYNKKNYKEAITYLLPAAEQGLDIAQYDLGGMYNLGYGVSQNYYEAKKWYQKAAEQGYAKAQYCLGDLYNGGLGVTRDYYEAVKWYQKAADQGYAPAQQALSLMYEYGMGVEKDIEMAKYWYEKASTQENKKSKQ